MASTSKTREATGIPLLQDSNNSEMKELQSLIQECLLGSGHVECAAIIQKRNGLVRATSVGYEVTAEQSFAILSGIENPPLVRETGLRFNGATYKCVRCDKDALYGKKVRNLQTALNAVFPLACRTFNTSSTQENSGFVAIQTKSYVIYGSYNSSMLTSVCVESVEKLADYFKAKGK